MLESDLTFYLQAILRKHLPRIRFELVRVDSLKELPPGIEPDSPLYQVVIHLKPSEMKVPEVRSFETRPSEITTSEFKPSEVRPHQGREGIYHPNGSLNVPFLKENADLLFQAGEYALAKRIYQTLIQSGERAAILSYRLGLCFEAEGKLEEACQKYNEAVQVYPNLEIYYRWAEVLKRQSKNQQAAEVLERARTFKTRVPFLN